MNIVAVESSVLKAVAYDERLALLRLEFRNRAVYDYVGVPAAVHDALLNAPSVGACFNDVVRGRFPFRLVPASGPEPGAKGDR